MNPGRSAFPIAARAALCVVGTLALCVVAIGPADPASAGDAAKGDVAMGAAATGAAAESAAVPELVQRGNAARQAGRLPEAIEAYRAAAAIDPRRYEIRILIADTLRRLGHAEEANTDYAAAVALDPARSEGYTGQALLLRAEFDYAAAAAIVEPAIEGAHGNDRADLLISLGETRRRQGRAAESQALFQRALQSDAGATTAHAGLARLAEERGDLDAALSEWDLYMKSRPDDGAADLRRQELRELRASVAALRSATAGAAGRGPGGADLYAELGRLLAVIGDAPGAVAASRSALKIDARKIEARRGLALALLAAGDERGAATEFRRLLRAQPAEGTALFQLAAMARRSGDPAAEQAAWIEALRRRPDDLYAARAFADFLEHADAAVRQSGRAALDAARLPEPAAQRLRALIAGAAGRWPEAEEALYQALRPDPTDPWTLEIATDLLARRPALLEGLGRRARAEAAAAPDVLPLLLLERCLSLAGHDDEALLLARRAAAARPDSAPARSALAEAILESSHDVGTAVEQMRRAVDLDPQRIAAHVDLTLALLRAGRPSEAEAAARRGLAQREDAAPLLSLLAAALADQGDLEGAARAHAAALVADPADNLHLSRSQYPSTLAGLGRTFEARRALAGTMPEIPDLAYLEAWTFARDLNRDRAFAGQNWMSWRDRFHGRLVTPEDAHRAIAKMLRSLGDPYTRLRDPEETAATFLTRHAGPAGADALGLNRPHGRTVVVKDLEDGLGYIQITNLTDPNAIAEVRQALLAMRRKEGIVIDLRGNPGGLTRAADAVADMLIGPGQEAGVDVGPEGRTPRVTGGDGALTDAPITVLVDGQTGSAAERLAGSLEATGRGTLVGDTTHGKGLFQNARVLPGGCTVLVSAGEALGPDGRPIQGRGLRPQQRNPSDAIPPKQ